MPDVPSDSPSIAAAAVTQADRLAEHLRSLRADLAASRWGEPTQRAVGCDALQAVEASLSALRDALPRGPVRSTPPTPAEHD